MGQCHHKGPSPSLNAKVGRLYNSLSFSSLEINSLSGLLAVKMIRQQIGLTNLLTHQSTTLSNERRQ